MAIFLWFIPFCLAGTCGASPIVDNDFEFGRIALPLSSKRREYDASDATVFASIRWKGKHLRQASEFNLDEEIELERDLLFLSMSMSMSMSFVDPPDIPSMPSVPSRTPAPHPSHPTTPSQPSSPSQPSNPSQPSSPGQPSNPSSPSNPTNASTPTSPSASGPSTTTAPSLSQNPATTHNPASLSPTIHSSSSPATPYPTFEATTPTQAPSIPAATPSVVDTTNPTNTAAPTFTAAPFTSAPSATPLVPKPGDSTENLAPVPSVAPTTVFELSKETNGVIIVEPPHGNTTVVRLEIVYLVEALVAGTAAFRADLDWLILKTAVVASLGGNNSGVLDQLSPSRRLSEFEPRSKGDNRQRNLLSSSSFLRSCNATITAANCYIMEADIVYILNGTRNTDMAAYLAYLALNNEMGSFDDGLANVSRVEYLSPQPILPPVALDGEESAPNSLLTSGGTRLSVNGWTVGAAVACSTVGAMALVFWNRNRRTRNRRHIQLLEDVSEAQTGTRGRESATREIVAHPL